MFSLLAYSRRQRIPSTLSRFFFRHNSTSSHSARRFGFGKAFVIGATAGVTGAGTLLVGGYAWYHYSGMKQAVDTFKPAMRSLGQARDQLNKNAPPSLVLGYLRQAAKTYVAIYPGAGFLVDIAFNVIDQTVDTHAEEANAILNKVYTDILRIVKKGGNEHRMGSFFDILAIARNPLKDIEIEKHAASISTAVTSALDEIKKLEIKKHAATIATAATSALDEIKKREIEKHAAKAATSALDEIKKFEVEKHAATISTAVTSTLDGIKLEIKKHAAVTSALDEIKSRTPAAQQSLSDVSKTTDGIGKHDPQLWRKVEAKPAAAECPEANSMNTTEK